MLSLYVAWRVRKGDQRFALARDFGVAFGALGGTSFCGADLTEANFTAATLKSSNFNASKQKPTILTHVCWKDVKQLDRARVGDSLLSNAAVRDLLVTRNGYKKSYIRANLRGANLSGVELQQADLQWADLSEAILQQANLRDANLRETPALGTDFRHAYLTGACLEAWNIDFTTQLDQADCQFVYLLRDQQERRPSSGNFDPGEFTKLFQEVLSTVDLIFRDGIDWKAFTYSFNQLVLDNEGTELSIQSIENKGDGVVVVRVNAPPNADKAKLHSEFNQTYETAIKTLEAKYQSELQAKDEQITIYREHNADLREIIHLKASQPINLEINNIAESKSMNDSTDQSRNLTVSGNLTATGSTFNLGENQRQRHQLDRPTPNHPRSQPTRRPAHPTPSRHQRRTRPQTRRQNRSLRASHRDRQSRTKPPRQHPQKTRQHQHQSHQRHDRRPALHRYASQSLQRVIACDRSSAGAVE